MGAEVSRDKFVDNNLQILVNGSNEIYNALPNDKKEELELPINFDIVRENLYVSGMPVTNNQLKTLHTFFGVKHVLTLLTMPLKGERMLNVNPNDPSTIEFHDTDKNLLDGLEELHGMKFHNLPIADGYFPTNKIIEKFIEICGTAIEKNENILIHCWQGKGRSWTMALYLMKYFYKANLDEMKKILNKSRIGEPTKFQWTFLKNEEFYNNDEEDKNMLFKLCSQFFVKRCSSAFGNPFKIITKFGTIEEKYHYSEEKMIKWRTETLLKASNNTLLTKDTIRKTIFHFLDEKRRKVELFYFENDEEDFEKPYDKEKICSMILKEKFGFF